jgi:hypothetical protein
LIAPLPVGDIAGAVEFETEQTTLRLPVELAVVQLPWLSQAVTFAVMA